jgi:hypothetical protein
LLSVAADPAGAAGAAGPGVASESCTDITGPADTFSSAGPNTFSATARDKTSPKYQALTPAQKTTVDRQALTTLAQLLTKHQPR